MTSLAEDFPKQQRRCRALLDTYRNLPNGAGTFAAAMIEQVLNKAEIAAASGDVVAMITVHQEMSECK